MNIVIVRTNYTKKTNLNKAPRIQFESIPRDLSGLILMKNYSKKIARPSKPSTIFPNARTRRGSDSLRALFWMAASRGFFLKMSDMIFFFSSLEVAQHDI